MQIHRVYAALYRIVWCSMWVTMIGAAYANDPQAAPLPELQRRLLAQYDSADDPVQRWQISVPPDHSSINVRHSDDHPPTAHGRSLRLDYAFSPTATEEISVRLHLDQVDARAFDHLTLWVKSTAASNPGAFEVSLLRPKPARPELLEAGSYLVAGVESAWQQVVIPLNAMLGIRDWQGLTELRITLHPRRSTVRQGTLLFGEFALIHTGRPGPRADDPAIAVAKTAWQTAAGGAAVVKPILKARLNGWPGYGLVDPATLPKDDDAFLQRLARDTWAGVDALTDRYHGVPLDTVTLRNASPALEHAEIGDYTSTSDIGFYILAVIAAQELGLIDRTAALQRLRTTLDTLQKLETYRGFYYNYYDTTTLERTSHFISFVDSAWLTAGLIVARNSYNELAGTATKLLTLTDYSFFYDPVKRWMHHGYYVNVQQPAPYHYGTLYAESRIGSLIAIGKNDAPAEHWFAMHRTFPPEYNWQSQQPMARRSKQVAGYTVEGGYYQWQHQQFVPSWGGSMFEALMPLLVLDEITYAPRSLGANDKTYAELQRRYALERLGYRVWGLSPSSVPASYLYGEFGAKPLGVAGYPSGVISPHASALALAVMPKAAIANLRELAHAYPLYGSYGFYDAVEPSSGNVAYKYLSLNQSMILVALANHLANQVIQKRFAADPIIQPVLTLLGHEDFFD